MFYMLVHRSLYITLYLLVLCPCVFDMC